MRNLKKSSWTFLIVCFIFVLSLSFWFNLSISLSQFYWHLKRKDDLLMFSRILHKILIVLEGDSVLFSWTGTFFITVQVVILLAIKIIPSSVFLVKLIRLDFGFGSIATIIIFIITPFPKTKPNQTTRSISCFNKIINTLKDNQENRYVSCLWLFHTVNLRVANKWWWDEYCFLKTRHITSYKFKNSFFTHNFFLKHFRFDIFSFLWTCTKKIPLKKEDSCYGYADISKLLLFS